MQPAAPPPRPAAVPPLADRIVRASPAYRLVGPGAYQAEQDSVLELLARDEEHAGLLVPAREHQRGVKAIDGAMAGLFVALGQPRSVAALRAELAVAVDDLEIAGLVLDGVLELADGAGYVAGPQACDALGLGRASGADQQRPGRLARLADRGLALAHALPIEEPARLSAWLYAFGTLPTTEARVRELDEPDTVLRRLGLAPGAALRRRLDDAYLHGAHAHWSSWTTRARGEERLPYKLYVSPTPGALAEVAGGLVEVALATDVPAFKLGARVGGLVRPDKLVLYLRDWQQVQRVAAALTTALVGVPAHGVPFTAALTDDGLLSWGMDPPPSARLVGWRGAESWRSWLCDRLARALLHARATGAGSAASVGFAHARLGLEGIDTSSWAPAVTGWQPAAAVRPQPASTDHPPASPPQERS